MPLFSRRKKTDTSPSPARSPTASQAADVGIEGLEDITDILDTQIGASNPTGPLGLADQFRSPNDATMKFGSSEDAPPVVPYAPPSPRASVTVVPDFNSPSSPPFSRPSTAQPLTAPPEQLSFRATNTTPLAASPPPMPSGTRNPQYLDTTPSPSGVPSFLNGLHNTGSSSDGGHTNPPHTRSSSPIDFHHHNQGPTQDLSTPYGQQIRRQPAIDPAAQNTVGGVGTSNAGADWRQNYQFASITPSTPPTVIVSTTPEHAITPSPRSQTASPLGNTARGPSSELQQHAATEEEADQLTQRIKVVEKENVVLSANLQHVCEENARISEQMEKLQTQLTACLASSPSAGLSASPSASPQQVDSASPTSVLASIKDPEIVKGWFGGTSSTTKGKETFRELSIRLEQEYTAYRSTHVSDNDEVRALLEEVKKANTSAAELAKVIATTRSKGECAIVIRKRKDNSAAEKEELAKFEAQKARQLLEQQIDKLKGQIREHQDDNETLNNSILELQKKISKNKDVTTDLQRRLEEANGRADAAEEKVNSLQQELVDFKMQVDELKATLNESRNNSDDEAEAEELRKSAVAEAVAAVTADLARARELNEKERTAATQREKKLRADLDAAENSLAEAKTKLATLQKEHTKEISALEERLKQMSEVNALAATAAAAATNAQSAERHKQREDELWAAQEASEAEITGLKERLASTEKALEAAQAEIHASRDIITNHELNLSLLQQQMEAERRQSSIIENKFIAAQEKMAKMDLIVLEQQQEIRSISPPKKGRDKTPSRTSRGASLDVGSISASRVSDLQVQLDHATEENKKLSEKIDSLYTEAEEAAKRQQQIEEELNTQKRFLAAANSALEEEKLKSQMLESAVRAEAAERDKRRLNPESPRSSSRAQSPVSANPPAANPTKKSMSRNGKAPPASEDNPPGSPFGNTRVSPSAEPSDDEMATAQEIADLKLKKATDRYLQDLKEKDDMIKVLQTKLIDSQMLMAKMDGEKESTVSLARFSTLEVANDSLKAELIEKEAELKSLQNKVTELKSRVDALEKDAEVKDELLEKNEAALKEATDCLETAQKELDRRDKVRQQEAEELKIRLSKNNADAATQLAHVRNQLEEKSTEAAKALEENKKLRAENEALSNNAKVNQTDQTNAILKKDNAAKVREVNLLQETIKGLREELATAKAAAVTAASKVLAKEPSAAGGMGSVTSAFSRASPSPAPPTDAIVVADSSPSRLTNPPTLGSPNQTVGGVAAASSSDLQQRYNDLLATKVKSEYKSKRKITHLETVNAELELLVQDLQTTVRKLEYDKVLHDQEKLINGSKSKGSKATTKTHDISDPNTVSADQFYRVKVELDKKNVEIKKLTQAITSQAEDYRELIKNLETKVRAQQDALVVAKLTADPTNTFQLLNHNHPLVNSTPQRTTGPKNVITSPTATTITFATPSPAGKRGRNTDDTTSNPLIPLVASPSAETIRLANENLNKDREVLIRKVAELEDTIDMLVDKIKTIEQPHRGVVKGEVGNAGLFLHTIDEDEEGENRDAPAAELTMGSISNPPSRAAPTTVVARTASIPSSVKPPSSNVSSRPATPPAAVGDEKPKKKKSSKSKSSANVSESTAEATAAAAANIAALQRELDVTKKENEVLSGRIDALEDQLSHEQASNTELHQQVSEIAKLKAENEKLNQALLATSSASPTHLKPPLVNGKSSALHSRANSNMGEDGEAVSPKTSSQMNRELSELKRSNSHSAHELLLAKTELSVMENDLKSKTQRLKAITEERDTLQKQLSEVKEQLEAATATAAQATSAAPPVSGPAWLRSAKPTKVRKSIYEDPEDDDLNHEDEDEDVMYRAPVPPATTKSATGTKNNKTISSSSNADAEIIKSLQAELIALKHAHAEALSELEDANHNEMQRLKQEMSRQETEYQEEIEHLQMELHTAEKTITEQKQQLADAKEALSKALASAAEATAKLGSGKDDEASTTTAKGGARKKSLAATSTSAKQASEVDAEIEKLKADLEQKSKDFLKLKAAFEAYRAAIEDEEDEEYEEDEEVESPKVRSPKRKPNSPKGFAQPQQIKELTATNAKLSAEVASLTATLKKKEEELKYAQHNIEFLEGQVPAEGTLNGSKKSSGLSLAAAKKLNNSGKGTDLEDATELVRLTEELVDVKQSLAEHMAVTDRLGLKRPFNDPRLERCAKIRLDAVMLLEAAENAKFYFYDAKNNKSMSPPGKGGAGAPSSRSMSAPAPRSALRETSAGDDQQKTATGPKKSLATTAAAPKKTGKSSVVQDEEEEDALNNSSSVFAEAVGNSNKPAEVATKKKVTVLVPANNPAAKPASKAAASGAAAAIATTTATVTATSRQPRFANSRQSEHSTSAASKKAPAASTSAEENAPQTQKAASERGALLSRKTKKAEDTTPPASKPTAAEVEKPKVSAQTVSPAVDDAVLDDDKEMINPKTGRPMTAWQRASALEAAAAAEKKKSVAAGGNGAAASVKATAPPNTKAPSSAFRAPADSENDDIDDAPPEHHRFDEDKIEDSDEETMAKKPKGGLFGGKSKAAPTKAATETAKEGKKKLGILERAAARFKNEDDEYAKEEKRKQKLKKEQKKKARNESSEESEDDDDDVDYGGYSSGEAALRAVRRL